MAGEVQTTCEIDSWSSTHPRWQIQTCHYEVDSRVQRSCTLNLLSTMSGCFTQVASAFLINNFLFAGFIFSTQRQAAWSIRGLDWSCTGLEEGCSMCQSQNIGKHRAIVWALHHIRKRLQARAFLPLPVRVKHHMSQHAEAYACDSEAFTPWINIECSWNRRPVWLATSIHVSDWTTQQHSLIILRRPLLNHIAWWRPTLFGAWPSLALIWTSLILCELRQSMCAVPTIGWTCDFVVHNLATQVSKYLVSVQIKRTSMCG